MPTPRIETPNPKAKSRGADIAEFADRIGVPLLPWQRHLFDHALALDKTGKWRATEVCAVIARQQGKTHAARLRIAFGLCVLGEKSIVGTAQDRQLARDTFENVVELMHSDPELSKQIATVRWANGQEELRTKAGQRYRVVAPTPSAARGYSNDLVLIDEVREQTDFDLWAAIRPTINTRKNATVHGPQVWLTSNAGHADSVLLLQMRRQAQELIAEGKPGSLAYLEWSAPEDAALDDEQAIAQANPALGRLIDLDQIRALRRSTPEPVYRTEQLCQFVDVMQNWLPHMAWEECEAGHQIPDDARGEVVFAVDRAPSWDHATITVAAPVAGRVVVEVVKAWDAGVTETTLRDYLVGLVERWHPRAVVADDRMLGDLLNAVTDHTGAKVHKLRGVDISRACSSLYQAVTSGQVAHNGDPLLADHVRAAARRDLGDTWVLSRRHSARHIDACMAAAFAVYGLAVEGDHEFVLPTRRS